MRLRIVRIGNSRGIRIPKSLLKEAQLTDAVDITVVGSALMLRSPKRHVREGWAEAAREMHEAGAEAAREMHEAGEDKLLDGWDFPNEFDHTEWEWPGLE